MESRPVHSIFTPKEVITDVTTQGVTSVTTRVKITRGLYFTWEHKFPLFCPIFHFKHDFCGGTREAMGIWGARPLPPPPPVSSYARLKGGCRQKHIIQIIYVSTFSQVYYRLAHLNSLDPKSSIQSAVFFFSVKHF